VRRVLLEAFGAVARLLHPISPFLAEELYQRLRAQDPGHPRHGQDAPPSVMVASYPKTQEFAGMAPKLAEADFIKEIITAVRRLRAEFNVPIKQQVVVLARGSQEHQERLLGHRHVVRALCRAEVQWHGDEALPTQAALEVVQGCELCVPLAGIIDVAAELTRLDKELKKCAADGARIEAQLGRPDFVARAPKAIVEEKHGQLAALKERETRLSTAAGRLRAG
jgi:valyl-tRNA synthetase